MDFDLENLPAGSFPAGLAWTKTSPSDGGAGGQARGRRSTNFCSLWEDYGYRGDLVIAGKNL